MLEVAHFCSRVYTKIYLDVTKFLLPIFQLHNYIWNQSKKYWLQMSQLKMQSNDNNKNIANDDNHHHNNNNNNNSSEGSERRKASQQHYLVLFLSWLLSGLHAPASLFSSLGFCCLKQKVWISPFSPTLWIRKHSWTSPIR